MARCGGIDTIRLMLRDDADVEEITVRARATSRKLLLTLERASADLSQTTAGLSPDAVEAGRQALAQASAATAHVTEALNDFELGAGEAPRRTGPRPPPPIEP